MQVNIGRHDGTIIWVCWTGPIMFMILYVLGDDSVD